MTWLIVIAFCLGVAAGAWLARRHARRSDWADPNWMDL